MIDGPRYDDNPSVYYLTGVLGCDEPVFPIGQNSIFSKLSSYSFHLKTWTTLSFNVASLHAGEPPEAMLCQSSCRPSD